MKICLQCQTQYPTPAATCPSCQHSPGMNHGFITYAPEIETSENAYRAEFYDSYASIEANHFWFRNRASLVVWALKKYMPRLTSFFEIGCGTGYVMEKVKTAFPDAKLCGSEIFTTALSLTAIRLQDAELVQIDARRIPFIEEFSVIGAFDVLEHINEDEQVLREMYKSLNHGGIILISVPQHMWMWSQVDDYSCHVRRYSANEIHQKVERAGFKILRSTSFVSLLLPAMFLSRFWQSHKKAKTNDATAELRIPIWINAIFHTLLTIERTMISLGVNFPIGGSRLVVARKIK